MNNNLTTKESHDKHNPEHSGLLQHSCPNWDYLYICADCPEFDACLCFSPDPQSLEAINNEQTGRRYDKESRRRSKNVDE